MPDHSTDLWWLEVQSQVLCGLFQVAAMIKHPLRCKSLYWWVNAPATSAAEYKNVPRDRVLTVLVLFHLNCVFQYCVCVFMWGWWFDWVNRPAWGVPVFLVLSFSTEVVGGVLLNKSTTVKPLSDLEDAEKGTGV